jgi:hypothetical protein
LCERFFYFKRSARFYGAKRRGWLFFVLTDAAVETKRKWGKSLILLAENLCE